MLRRFLFMAIAAALLAACGSGQDGGSAATDQEGTRHTEADLAFVGGMIPHHQQALEMAELVERRTGRPELLALAGAIIKTQGHELGLMQSWLSAWGEKSDGGGMDHGSGQDAATPGMMPQAQMNELMGLKDTDFDLAFITMMSEHHLGAIEMAETELRDGINADAKKLAAQIVADQRKEIDTMARWRQQWATAS
jgi:uncharacterized protein (DUF305 family)